MKYLVAIGIVAVVLGIAWGIKHDYSMKYKTGIVYQKSYVPESNATGTAVSSSGHVHVVSSHQDAEYDVILTNGTKLSVPLKQYVRVEKGDKVKYKDGVFSDKVIKIK